MTNRPATDTLNPHEHATIGEVGECAECRAGVIANFADDPHAFVLMYFEDGGAEPDSIAVVRQPSPDGEDAVETAWATGCNPGTTVAFREIPVEALERSGVPTFTLPNRTGRYAGGRRSTGRISTRGRSA